MLLNKETKDMIEHIDTNVQAQAEVFLLDTLSYAENRISERHKKGHRVRETVFDILSNIRESWSYLYRPGGMLKATHRRAAETFVKRIKRKVLLRCVVAFSAGFALGWYV